ncbi:hypothetical protein [Pararhodonellum marinum]|uniref:hypothetical protein n=1 Tax=Pararhodonellum marinum TaxID=2755358 RepID=UPI00188F3BCA|nr:hypothetical protein [Pararhodonellum marinum]
MAKSNIQDLPLEKLVTMKRTLLTVTFVPAVLLIVYLIYVFNSNSFENTKILLIMFPVIAIGGIFLPIMQLGKINAELKRRKGME